MSKGYSSDISSYNLTTEYKYIILIIRKSTDITHILRHNILDITIFFYTWNNVDFFHINRKFCTWMKCKSDFAKTSKVSTTLHNVRPIHLNHTSIYTSSSAMAEREGLFSTIQQICSTKQWQQQNKVEGCQKGTRPILAGHPWRLREFGNSKWVGHFEAKF